jgi:hypothetical protein
MYLDKQATFDFAYRHASKMKALAKTSNGVCKYRAPNGEKCLIGAFIPDKDYRMSMEGRNVYSIMYYANTEIDTSGIDDLKDAAEFLSDLQVVHDQEECKTTEDLMAFLRDFATKNELSIPSL